MEAADFSKVEIVAVADRNLEIAKAKRSALCLNAETISVEKIADIDCDYVVVCSDDYSYEMMSQLMDIGISQSKICYIPSVPTETQNGNKLLESIKPYLQKAYPNNEKLNELLSWWKSIQSKFLISDNTTLFHKRLLNNFYEQAQNDYVRTSTLDLIADQIISHKVKGSVAELGVWKGTFASLLNELFHDRTLYLFDTFDGFAEKDIQQEPDIDSAEVNLNQQHLKNIECYSTLFRNSDIQAVISRMPNPERVLIKQGYFPETLSTVPDDAQFAFVSIDTDLYAPTYSGLTYFYQHLNKGGYILIHDYNSRITKGVKAAVDRFCGENSITLVPVADSWGTAIIAK
jgi:hypothetical protein